MEQPDFISWWDIIRDEEEQAGTNNAGVDRQEAEEDRLSSISDRGDVFFTSILRELEVNRDQRKGLNYSPYWTRQEHTLPDRVVDDAVVVTSEGDDIHYSVELGGGTFEGSSYKSGHKQISAKHKHKLRHEIVCEAFQMGPSDCSLKDVFPALGDGMDNLTPDFLVKREGVVIAVEVTTTRNSQESHIHSVFKTKVFKYEDALRQRASDTTVLMAVIIVTENAVYSNFKVPQALINDMVARFRIGKMIEDVAKSCNIDMELTDLEERLMESGRQIKHNISQMSFNNPPKSDRVTIDDKFITDVIKPLTDDQLRLVGEAYKASWRKAKKKVILTKKVKTSEAEFVNSLSSRIGTTRYEKPVINLPILIVKPTKFDQKVRHKVNHSFQPQDAVIKLWKHCLSPSVIFKVSQVSDHKRLLDEAIESNPRRIEELQNDRKKVRSKYHRVSVKDVLSVATKKELALDGLFGKSHKTDPSIQAKRLERKKPFSWGTDTTDIDKFIGNPWFLEDHGKELPDSQTMINKLISRASEIVENNGVTMEAINSWQRTNVFQWLDWISDVGMELIVSVKQNTNSGEMIIKKLAYWDCYLLIHPTTSKSHMFVSFFFPNLKEDPPMVGPGIKLYESPLGYYTKFVSFRADKLENLATMSSSLLTFSSFWSDFHDLEGTTPDSFRQSAAAFTMLMLTMLIRLEDKASTEEVFTTARYMYMEIFKSGQSVAGPDPFKVVDKLPSCPRSRLTLWAMKKLIGGMRHMLDNPPTRKPRPVDSELEEGEDNLPGDEWDGLTNVYNGHYLTTSSQAVELFYLGYVKNKNETSQRNNDWRLVEKIVEEEISLDVSEEGKLATQGLINHKKIPKGKQFSRYCIMAGADRLIDKLKQDRGAGWCDLLTVDILNSLGKKMTHMIATLKASSSLTDKNVKIKMNKTTNKDMVRIKVIEALASKLSKVGLSPMERISYFIEALEKSSNGVICDIFDKNQHGGIREIYVLNIESRLVQLFIETVSRELCSQFEEETLTHPQNKMKLLDGHKTRSCQKATKFDLVFSNTCSSSDKKRWNQNFVMTAMSIPLFRITDPIFHPAIQRSLNLWSNKLIKLPSSVITLLLNKTPLSSKAYQDLCGKFWGKRQPGSGRYYLREPYSGFLNTTTGMMQGILHYTSSLLHLCFLYQSKELSVGNLARINATWSFSMTQVCSSDDSASILTAFHPRTGLENMASVRAVGDVEVALFALTYFCRYYCMLESSKSTIGLRDYVEFNSEFLFANNLVKAKIKHVAASTNLTECESFIQRFHTQYNLITDIATAGMPFNRVSLCQSAQAYLHYKTMGASTSCLFNHWLLRVEEMPHPMLGFFLMDTDKLAGIMGWSYSYWLAITKVDALKRLLPKFNIIDSESVDGCAAIHSLRVKHGDSKKHHLLLDRVEKGSLNPKFPTMYRNDDGKLVVNKRALESRRERMVSNPELLYSHPRNMEDLTTKLLIKASMPGVATSLSKGNPFCQAVAMSVYSLYSHCFTITEKKLKKTTQNIMKLETSSRKVSLIGMMNILDKKTPEGTEGVDVQKYLPLLFPLHDRYKDVYEMCSTFSGYDKQPIHRIRQRKSYIKLQPRFCPVPVSLQATVCHFWFNQSVQMSKSSMDRVWTYYTEIYPWLTLSHDDSLQQSPFKDALEMAHFISSQKTVTRQLLFIGPGIYSNSMTGQVYQLIRKHYCRGALLNPAGHTERSYVTSKPVTAQLSLALTIPLRENRETIVNKILGNSSTDNTPLADVNRLPKNHMALALCTKFRRGEITKEQVVSTIQSAKLGTLVRYITPQTKQETQSGEIRWMGLGTALVLIDGTLLKVSMRDDKITSITTKSQLELRQNIRILHTTFKLLMSSPITNPNQWIAGNPVGVYNGVSILNSQSVGTPIYEDSKLSDFSPCSNDIDFEIRYGECGFYTRLGNKTLPVLVFKSVDKDFTRCANQKPDDRIWRAWVNFSPADTAIVQNLITKCSNDLNSRSWSVRNEASLLKNWIKRTLMDRLMFMGTGLSTVDHGEDFIMEDDATKSDFTESGIKGMLDDVVAGGLLDEDSGDEDLEFFMETDQLGADGGDEVDLPVESHLGLKITMEELEDLIQSQDILFHNLERCEQAHESTIYEGKHIRHLHVHPFWDAFIDSYKSSDSLWFNRLLMGELPIQSKTIAEQLMKIIDQKVIRIQAHIQDRKPVVSWEESLGWEPEDQ